MTSADKDYFSKQSTEYAKFRPHYPDSLFTYLASLTPYHQCAVDCATGNGQAALGLAEHFNEVIAVDHSEAQIAGAFTHPKVQYRVGRVEQLDLPPKSVDLVTVAQALHWFNLDKFYEEVKRILKSDGAIAVWTYYLTKIEPAVDRVIHRYHDEILHLHWPQERGPVIDGYRSLPFPFREARPPVFPMEMHWTLENFLGYLRSWSATQRYVDARGENPLNLITDELQNAWGHPDEEKLVQWPLSLRVGKRFSAESA